MTRLVGSVKAVAGEDVSDLPRALEDAHDRAGLEARVHVVVVGLEVPGGRGDLAQDVVLEIRPATDGLGRIDADVGDLALVVDGEQRAAPAPDEGLRPVRVTAHVEAVLLGGEVGDLGAGADELVPGGRGGRQSGRRQHALVAQETKRIGHLRERRTSRPCRARSPSGPAGIATGSRPGSRESGRGACRHRRRSASSRCRPRMMSG